MQQTTMYNTVQFISVQVEIKRLLSKRSYSKTLFWKLDYWEILKFEMKRKYARDAVIGFFCRFSIYVLQILVHIAIVTDT